MNNLRQISHRLFVEALRPQPPKTGKAGRVTRREPAAGVAAGLPLNLLAMDEPMDLPGSRPLPAGPRIGWT